MPPLVGWLNCAYVHTILTKAQESDGRSLLGVTILAAVVESGSFARAAVALGMSDSGVGRAVARLEHRIGIRLLDRNPRSMTLTDEGRRFYEHVVPSLVSHDDQYCA